MRNQKKIIIFATKKKGEKLFATNFFGDTNLIDLRNFFFVEGGEIVFRGNCFRVMGDLAMSRSFGDLRLKEPVPLVISEPEINIEELTPKGKFFPS